MAMTNEAHVLRHMMERTREWTLFHLNALKGQDPHRRFEVAGKPFNTVFWTVAHLAVTENGLLLAATGGPFEKFSWAKHFTLGAGGLPPEECPPFTEVQDTFHRVHQKAMDHLATLDAAALEAPNQTKLTAIGSNVRDLVTHAIRHEAGHAGQLAWLCKMYGIKLI
ncbi:MAG: DinB family protein [Flavobacteriales bacterium]|nr:DinB family protein [Flavobacteriales bacterium]MCL4281327.1 DinB family protein [Flavobacteriales bacterium]